MSNKTICDNCKKTQKNHREEDWVSLSLKTNFIDSKEYGLDSNYNSWDFCPKCAQSRTKKILKLIKQK